MDCVRFEYKYYLNLNSNDHSNKYICQKQKIIVEVDEGKYNRTKWYLGFKFIYLALIATKKSIYN